MRKFAFVGVCLFLGARIVSAVSFVPAGGDLASQTATDWDPEGVPTSTTAVTVPNAGTYWASANVAFNALTFSAAGETVVDQHAKGYDGVTVAAKGTTWALCQSANASIVRLKGGIWDFSSKNTSLGAEGSSFNRCGIYLEDGAKVTIGDWRGSVHWSSSTQMLDNASSVTASGTGHFIYDRQNKKYSQNNRFIIKGGSVFTASSFVTYATSGTFNETHVSGNEMLITGTGSKLVVDGQNKSFSIGAGAGEDFTVRVENGGEISGQATVNFGSSNNRLIVDGGKLSSKFSLANTNNLVAIRNVSNLTLSLPTTPDPMGGSYNRFVLSDDASVILPTTYLFNSGHHNLMRVTDGATCTVDADGYVDISRAQETSDNTLLIDDGGRLDVGFLRLSGDRNEIVISNGTLCARKINNGFGITLGYYDERTGKPVMRLQGTQPRVTKGEGKVVFLVKAGAELSFELPAEGYADGAVISMGTFEVNAGAKISVDCRALQKTMTESGVSKRTFVLAEQTDGITVDSGVLAEANANIVADNPERCRLYLESGKLKLDVKCSPRGMILLFR